MTLPAKLLLFTAGTLGMAGCSPSGGDEEKIDRAVDEMIAAAEEKDVGDMLEYLSEAYSDDRGNKKEDIKGYLIARFFRKQSLYVVKVGHTVTLDPDDPDKAQSEVKVFLAAGKGAVPNERDAQTFVVQWRKEDGQWRVISADNRQMRAGDIFGE